MHKVKTQRCGELFVKNMLIIHVYIVVIKMYRVKKFFNKFPERLEQISRNFPQEISRNFQTHNPKSNCSLSRPELDLA